MKKVTRQSQIPVFLMICGVGLLLGAFFWFQNSSKRTVNTPENVLDIPYPEVKRVSLADAKAAYDLGTAVFIDVRDEGAFAQGHIPGALSIPNADLLNEIKRLDPSQWYILYCT